MKQGGNIRGTILEGSKYGNVQYRMKGLTPLREVTIMDENEDSCISPQAQQQRWRRHFSRVLNVHNIVDMQEMNGIRQCPMVSYLHRNHHYMR